MKIYFHLNLEGFSNCYVIANDVTREAIIIDPGKITPEIIEHIERGGYKLTAVLITHNHGSHVHGLVTLQKIYSPEVYAAEWEVAGSATNILKDDGVIKIAGLDVEYYALPGHTSDSIVFKIGRVMFTGDSIAAGTLGSTNSKYSKQLLMNNIRTKIFSQSDDTVLMPGHGPPTTVGAEKLFNIELNPPQEMLDDENDFSLKEKPLF